MSEYAMDSRGYMGRSHLDCPERCPSEIKAEREEAVMARLTRADLEAALVILLSAIRTAEGEQGRLERTIGPHLSRPLRETLDNIGAALIEQGIDKVCDLIGDEALDILEASA